MEVSTYVPDTALSQGQQGSSSLPPSPGFSQGSPEEGALRYMCSQCHTSYAQRQGLGRHNRTVHNPNQCFLCEFRWGRPYEYLNHLRKKHPGVDPDMILGKAPGSRRRAIIVTEYLPQQTPVSPPAVEQDQQNCAESQPYTSAPPSPRVRVTSISPPVSSVDYKSQPVSAKQTITKDEHEYAHGSEFLDATYPLAMLLSTKESAKPVNDLDISVQDGQFGLPSNPGGSTPTHNPSKQEMARNPTLSPLIGENYGALVSEDRMVESFGPIRYSPLSDADVDATFNLLFTNSTFWR